MKSACVGVLSIIEMEMHGETLKYYTDVSLERLRNIMKTSVNNAYIQLLKLVPSSLKKQQC